MVSAAPALMKDCLWPGFEKYANMLDELIKEIMEDLLVKIYRKKGKRKILLQRNWWLRDVIFMKDEASYSSKVTIGEGFDALFSGFAGWIPCSRKDWRRLTHRFL